MPRNKLEDGHLKNIKDLWQVSLYLIKAIAVYGKDWKKVEERVGTRTGSQVRSHAQKFFNKLLKI
jgi:SHAQKYF class myb-like DNA-binding protein